MKNIIMVILIAVFGGLGTCAAATVGDINGDEQISLTEAMGALQITSGTRSPQYTSQDTYNGDEFQADFARPYRKIWRQTVVSNGSLQTGIGTERHYDTTFQEAQVEAVAYESGLWADYNTIDYFVGTSMVGYSEIYGEYTNSPPLETQMNDWPVGHRISNDYIQILTGTSDSYQIRYREYTLLGTEDVIVPAGTFSGCLKILSKRSSDSRVTISYFAKGIGLVKYFRAQAQGGGQIWDLMDIEKSDGALMYDQMTGTCKVEGTWETSQQCPDNYPICTESSKLTMVYSQSGGHAAFLNLVNFDFWRGNFSSALGMKLISNDGISFTPDPTGTWPDTNYDGTPDIPDISVTIENGQLTGSYGSATLSGTASCY